MSLISKTPSPFADRPRAVSVAGNIAVSLSSMMLLLLIVAMAQLNTAEATDELRNVLDDLARAGQHVSLDTFRTWVKVAISVLAVLSSTSLVLGWFVLRRHRGSRVALTVLGGVILLTMPLGWAFVGPLGWLLAIAIAVSIGLLWSPSARAWFARDDKSGPSTTLPEVPSPPSWPPPPSGWGPAPPPPLPDPPGEPEDERPPDDDR